MSEFYARIRGNRGEATRGGSKASGITATVETWQSILRVSMHCTDESDEHKGVSGHVSYVNLTDKHGNHTGFTLMFDADAIAGLAAEREVLSKEIEAVEQALDVLNKKARVLVQMKRNGVPVGAGS